MLRLALLAVALLANACRATPTIVPLHEQAVWSLDNHLGNNNVTLSNVTVPGLSLTALLEAGLITDPLYRYGELDTRWVSMDLWTWTARWNTTATSPWKVMPRTRLIFSSIDTIANVTLNGVVIGNVADVHRSHHFDVEDLLAEEGEENILQVTIHPTIPTIRVIGGAYPYRLPFSRYPGSLAQYNFVRKTATDFGWSYGPALMPHGIPGNVLLVSRDVSMLVAAGVEQTQEANGSVSLVFDYILIPGGNTSETGLISATITAPNGGSIIASSNRTVQVDSLTTATCAAVSYADPSVAPGRYGTCSLGAPVVDPAAPRSVSLTVNIPKDSVQLWYPYEFGDSPLYSVELAYQPLGHAADYASTYVSSLGLRSAVLSRQLIYADSNVVGETHQYQVNGLPVFARGAGIAPAQAIQTAGLAAAEVALVGAAVNSSFNALRVWGGGRYGTDEFYAAADEAGLMLLQDAMFTSAQYPVDDEFLADSRLEVAQQSMRLSWHPSIVSWAANSANEASMNWLNINGWSVTRFGVDQVSLSVGVIRTTIRAVDRTIPFMDTAPSNGVISTSPYVKRWGNTTNTSYGDVLFYDYESDMFDPRTFPAARFVSEFGYQSWPSYNVYADAVQPSDLGLRVPMALHRTRQVHGIDQLSAQLGRHFTAANAVTGLSRNNTVDPEQVRAFAHVTQVQQAVQHQTAVSKWRRGKIDGTRTGGVLHWQLNDVWAGCSWSSINVDGQWKVAQYTAKDTFSPTAALALYDGTTFSIDLHNDLPVDIIGDLVVSAVPYTATESSQVITLATMANALVSSYSGRQGVWSATAAAINNVAPAVRHIVTWEYCPSVARGGEAVASRVTLRCVGGALPLNEYKNSGLGTPVATLEAADPESNATLADGPLSLVLSSQRGVALWTSPLPPTGISGNFNASAIHVLPWQDVPVTFDLTSLARSNATDEVLSLTADQFASLATVDWLQRSMPLLKRTV